MERAKLSEMTAEQLAERFAALTLAEYEARAAHDAAKSHQLRAELNDVEEELRTRAEHEQDVLFLLAAHSDENVRVEAVAAMLRIMTGVKIGTKYIRMLAKEGNAPFLGKKEPSSPPVPAKEPHELRSMSVEQLVERFMALAIEYDEEKSPPENDRLYWQLDNVEHELKSREGEAWVALLSLYLHPDIRVRHEAAKATRDQVPELARDRLLRLDDEEWAPPQDCVGLFEPAVLAGRVRAPSGLKSLSADELVQRFTNIALGEEEALERFQIAKVNRLFGLMEAVEEELKTRHGDQRQALLCLYDHPSLQVRLSAVGATRDLAPEKARRVLQAIADSDNYPQAADARGMIKSLDKGAIMQT